MNFGLESFVFPVIDIDGLLDLLLRIVFVPLVGVDDAFEFRFLLFEFFIEQVYCVF